jgi:hypothetical protein
MMRCFRKEEKRIREQFPDTPTTPTQTENHPSKLWAGIGETHTRAVSWGLCHKQDRQERSRRHKERVMSARAARARAVCKIV